MLRDRLDRPGPSRGELDRVWCVYSPALVARLTPLPIPETMISDHRVEGVPTLVLANKQDMPGSMAVEDIKQLFNKLIVGKLNVSEGAVLPISALTGYECGSSVADQADRMSRDGIREAVNWLFLRVQK